MRLPIAAGLATAAVSLTLYPLFSGEGWFWSGLGALITVTAVGTLASRFALDRRLAPLAELLALGVFLTIAFTRDDAWAWIVPTKDSALALRDLLAEGFGDIQRFAAPVPSEAGISLLTSGGIGLIAILTDLFAVRLRRAALAGLPLLALFSVPAAVIDDPIAWPAVIIGAAGYIGLLLSDGRERIGQWGRPVLVRRSRPGSASTAGFAGRAQPPVDTGQLRLSGKRIGFAAIGLAILVPALIPTLQPAPLFGFGVGNGTGKGGNTITIPNPVAGLRGQLTQRENVTVLTYTSSDNSPRYLRLWSLDRFDGEEWGMTAPRGRPQDQVSAGRLPAPPGLEPTTKTNTVETSVTMSADLGRLNFLPLPYPASQVEAEGDWRADQSTLMVFSTKDEARGLEYRVLSVDPLPAPGDLGVTRPAPADIQERYLALPANLPKEIRDLTTEVTKGAATSYDRAVKLQEWFTKDGGFTYSLATKGQSNSALTDFLIKNRTGYCEQFAASMAVMARILGIPARVAIGYTGGSLVKGRWQVGTHDSHAWPELYFQGVGWLRFEPTPSGGAGQGTASVPDYTRPPATVTGNNQSAGNTPVPTASPGASGAAGAGTNADRRVRDEFNQGYGGVPIAVDKGLPLAAKLGIGAVILLLIALIPAVLRMAIRLRRRRRNTVHAAWTELCDVLADLGMTRQVSESPRALARRLTERYELTSAASAALARIATAEERLRYAPSPGGSTQLPGDAGLVRRALATAVPRTRRVMAVLTPPSTLLRIRGLGGKVLDGFDLLENLRPRPRGKRAGQTDRKRGGPEGGASEDRVLTRSGR